MKISHAYPLIIFTLFFNTYTREIMLAHPHRITPQEFLITTLDSQGQPHTRTLTLHEYNQYRKAEIQTYKGQSEGGFATVASIVDTSWAFPVHFQKTATKALSNKPRSERILVITLPGLGSRAFDPGAFASVLRCQTDSMLVGTVADKSPFHQNKSINNYRQGSLAHYIADQRTKQWGGALKRYIEEPVRDIIKLLEDGVTVTYQDGASEHIRPYDYGTIIVVGFCIGATTAIKVQEQLIMQGKRTFDGFILESPLADFHSPAPARWAKNPTGFGPAYELLPTLGWIYQAGKAVPTYILRGGHDELCTETSVLEVLRLSDHAKSLLVTTVPTGHARALYNDTSDKNVPDKRPWGKVNGCRQVHAGLMQEWLATHFMQK